MNKLLTSVVAGLAFLAAACSSSGTPAAPLTPTPTANQLSSLQAMTGAQVRIEVMAYMLYSLEDVLNDVVALAANPTDEEVQKLAYGRVENLQAACQSYSMNGLLATSTKAYCPQVLDAVEQYQAGNFGKAGARFQAADDVLTETLNSLWADFAQRY